MPWQFSRIRLRGSKTLFLGNLILREQTKKTITDSQESDVNKLLKTTSISLIFSNHWFSAGVFMSSSAEDDSAVFELRTYKSTPGNLGNLHTRFRDHTIRIFGKHGMKVVGFWSPTSEEERGDTLVYMLEHASEEAANASWEAFGQDPEWAGVSEASNANGRILAGVESKYMVATDYSPMK